MNRRSFLKLTVVTVVAPSALIHGDLLAQPDSRIGKIREVTACELNSDRYLIRHDICDRKAHIHYDQIADYSKFMNNPGYRKLLRTRARKALAEEMTKRGMRYNQLIRLDLPQGIHARYI